MSVNNLTYSQSGEHLTEEFETCRLVAYDDVRPNYVLKVGDRVLGTLTIGWGHTGPDVYIGQTITQAEAGALLLKDVAAAEAFVNAEVKVLLTQDEFDALVDFVFNAGTGNFGRSTLLADLNAGKFAEAAQQFDLWDRSAGKVLAGLLRRRQAEAQLFESA
jgi:lysozyme